MRKTSILSGAVALFVFAAFPVPAQEEQTGMGPDPLRQLSRRWFTWKDAGTDQSSLYAALGSEDVIEAERLWEEGLVLNDQFATAVHYAYGSPELRAFIRRHGPPEIGRGDTSLLAVLLSEGATTASAGGDPGSYYPFPTATSYLEDEKDPRRYSPEMAFDGRLDTAWVEGRDGSGIGQRIAFYVPAEAAFIGVLPGLADARWFLSNHRVKRARLTILELAAEPALGGYLLRLSPEPLATLELALKDDMAVQRFALPTVNLSPSGYLVGALEILDVYPTGKWPDTCISEIQFFDSAGARVEMGP